MLCAVLYQYGLRTWFLNDDFAFLGLIRRVDGWASLGRAIFAPTIHGTWRPLSNPAYFLAIQALFGAEDGLPFRVVAFLVQFANLGLLCAITRRITGSAAAGLLAPIIWVTNCVLVTAMCWNSAFDYLLSGLCLLGALWLWILYCDTGRRRELWGSWAVFLLGFLALETNLVFPALALAYALCFARPRVRQAGWLFVPSLLFVAAHELLIPKQVAGPYSPHLNIGVLSMLWRLWTAMLLPEHLTQFTGLPEWAGHAGAVVFSLALFGYAAHRSYRRDRVPAFCLAWFGIVAAPFLPFQSHLGAFYLTLPSIGVAMLAAYAARGKRLIAVVLLLWFAAENVPAAIGEARLQYLASIAVEKLVDSVLDVSEKHRGKIILLDGLPNDLFWNAVYHSAFFPYGIDKDHLYLSPGSDKYLTQDEVGVRVADFVLSPARTRQALAERELAVYRCLKDGSLTDITESYSAPRGGADVLETRLELGDPLAASQLGPGWFPREDGFRWMEKRAVVHLGVPADGGTVLLIEGTAPRPVGLTVQIDGGNVGESRILSGGEQFRLEFPLVVAAGKPVRIELSVDRTFREGRDNRELGLAVGSIQIR